jgi:HTH-type transcriptional regulator/antitoxin HigA
VQETEAKALIYRYMPVRELRRAIELPRQVDGLIAAVKDFWGIDELDFGFLEKEAQVCFRKSEAYRNFNPYYALSWLRLDKNSLVGRRPRVKYNRERLQQLADTLAEYTSDPDGVQKFTAELKRCGVVFFQLDHFQQTYVDGASFFDNGRPVIVYTARHDRNDNFWFTMAHELGHVLLHEDNQGAIFIDSMDHLDLSNKREKEADDFAERILKSKAVLKAFRDVKRPSVVKVRNVADELGLHPGIVAGCLQHHKKASYTSFHELKPAVREVLGNMD